MVLKTDVCWSSRLEHLHVPVRTGRNSRFARVGVCGFKFTPTSLILGLILRKPACGLCSVRSGQGLVPPCCGCWEAGESRGECEAKHLKYGRLR